MNNVKEAIVTPVQRKLLTLGFVPYGTGRREPFDVIFGAEKQVTPADILAGSVDALVIWGGEDIHPSLYNEEVNGAHVGHDLSTRDVIENGVCLAAIKAGVPIIGICRGAQLVCALAGGKLYQHVTGHMGTHPITTKDGLEYNTSSIHHQMMDVRAMPKEDYDLIAWSKNNLSKGTHADDSTIEPEIVYFPKIKGLAIQGHPEFMHPDCDFVTYTQKLVADYLLEK